MSTLSWLIFLLTLIQLFLLQPKNWRRWVTAPSRLVSRSTLAQLFRPAAFSQKTSTSLRDLPVELLLRIFEISATSSQSSYRSLVLTSRAIRELVRLESLPFLPIFLSKEAHFDSFLQFLESDSKVGPSIRYLWMIHLDYHCVNLPEQILTFCPNIVALACQPQSLLCFLSASTDAELPHCKELTLHDRVISSWESQSPNVIAFCNQIERLHLIGPFLNGWTIPSLPNLFTASVVYGEKPLEVARFREIFRDCTRLQRIALITELERKKLGFMHEQVKAWNTHTDVANIHLLSLPEDWTDMQMWLDGLYDRDLFWN